MGKDKDYLVVATNYPEISDLEKLTLYPEKVANWTII